MSAQDRMTSRSRRISTSGRPLLQRIADLLMPAAEPVRPAVLRIGHGAFSGVHNLRRRPMFRRLHRQKASQFVPVGPVRVLRRPLPAPVADALFDAAQVANLLATLGLGHRVTGPLNSALQLWTISYRNSWGMILHNDNQLTLHQAILGLSPAADVLSLDALRRSARRSAGRQSPVLRRSYGAVATALNIATVSVYLLSGVAKVRSPQGWSWASGSTLREQIAADAIRKEVFGSQPPRMAAVLYRGRGPIGVLAAMALVVELGAPLALLDRRLGQVFAVAAWGMHVGIRVSMGIRFTYNLSGVSYLPLFPIGRQLPPVRSFLPPH